LQGYFIENRREFYLKADEVRLRPTLTEAPFPWMAPRRYSWTSNKANGSSSAIDHFAKQLI